MPLPPSDEQLEIASALNRVDAMSISGVSRKQQLDSLFRTLLHQLMTAQLRVDQVDMSELKALGIETD